MKTKKKNIIRIYLGTDPESANSDTPLIDWSGKDDGDGPGK